MEDENNEYNLDKAKEIMERMANAIDNLVDIMGRVDAQPYYGRDARNLGVEDGYSIAPRESEINEAKAEAYNVCREAQEAGFIEKIPYHL